MNSVSKTFLFLQRVSLSSFFPILVEPTGFEPALHSLKGRVPMPFRRRLHILVCRVGVEPTTYGLRVRCSTAELPARIGDGCKQIIITTSLTRARESNHLVVSTSLTTCAPLCQPPYSLLRRYTIWS
jgi:hypothetical protein